MTPIQAIKDKVIVQPYAPEEKTEGGIIIPESAQKQLPQEYAKVLSVGEDVKGINEGDTVVYHAHRGGQTILHERNILKVIMTDEIYGIIKEQVAISKT